MDFSEIQVENCSFKEALMSQLALEELHIMLEDEEEKEVNVDYDCLPMEMKRRIDYTSITVIEIKIDAEKQRTKVLRKIFENLNAKGSLLTQQELRNGIYACVFYNMLQEYNRHDDKWRKIWGKEDAAERDIETLLRFCALKKYVRLEKKDTVNFNFFIENYHSSYTKLLDQFSEEAMEFDEEQIREYKNSLSCFFDLFKVNITQSSKVALLESFYIVYEKLGIRKPITSVIYNKILHDPGYISIKKIKDDRAVYFLDAVNRGFDVKRVSRINKKPDYKKTILDTRLQEVNFNLVDSFNCFGTWTERVEIIYQLYEKEVQDLFYELTNDRFKIDYDDPIGEVDFGNGKGLLSSGYQAIIRILLELLYYQDMEIERNALQYAWVVIDELDEYLSPRYSASILKFLKKVFPWGRWIVATHSCDLVVSANDSNLIILDNGSYEVADSNDYTSISEVQIIFDRVFGNYESFKSEIENIVRRLLNNKINGVWGERDEECLEQLGSGKLTASQQIIVRQIREW
ncbi:MAG: ATP-binding protein [Eubacterium sp.]|nr:ATP-binding protein [Eubacterium sp.]